MAIRITRLHFGNEHSPGKKKQLTHLEWTEDVTGTHGKWTILNMYYWIKNGGKAYTTDNSGNQIELRAERKLFSGRTITLKGKGDLVALFANS